MSTKNKKVFRITSRILLLLAVFGFFQPVACELNGPDMIRYGQEVSVCGWLLLVAAVFSLLALYSVCSDSRFLVVFFPAVAFAAVVAGFCAIVYGNGWNIFDEFQRGAWLMIGGTLGGLVFGCLSRASMPDETVVEEPEPDVQSYAAPVPPAPEPESPKNESPKPGATVSEAPEVSPGPAASAGKAGTVGDDAEVPVVDHTAGDPVMETSFEIFVNGKKVGSYKAEAVDLNQFWEALHKESCLLQSRYFAKEVVICNDSNPDQVYDPGRRDLCLISEMKGSDRPEKYCRAVNVGN